MSYDRNGNIASISRILGTESEAVPDTRDYFGNQLSVLVEDETDYPYEYDANGAMTYDGKNQVTLTRNILGLPYQLEDARGSYVEFSYLADGTKRYMVADTFEGPQYYGSFIYRYDEAAGETYLESIAHPEGRFAATSYTSQHEPVYSNLHYVTDRVGSVVAVVDLDSVANDGTDAVLEGNGYTPFGERFAIGDFPKMHLNRFRFNGKEHLNRFGLPYIDYGARYYDPTTARWQRPDPMADKYPDISPYAFCANDPVNFVDLNGLDTVYVLRVSDNPIGHIAILVPSEGQYVLYSKNGEKFTNNKDDRGHPIGESVQAFLDNATENTTTHGNRNNDNSFPYYDVAFAIDVSPEQVKSITQTMQEQTEHSEDYNLLSNNCTTSVSLALEKAGVKTTPEGPINYIDSHHEGLQFTPVVFYHQLKLANPTIKEINPSKK